MIITLKSITREGAQSYRVLLEEADHTTRVFTLTVEEGSIQVVTWQDDFATYMDKNLGPVSSLLEAVLAFHRGQNVEVPDR